jgi:hypothetical protein
MMPETAQQRNGEFHLLLAHTSAGDPADWLRSAGRQSRLILYKIWSELSKPEAIPAPGRDMVGLVRMQVRDKPSISPALLRVHDSTI